MGPGDLATITGRLSAVLGHDERVLVGPETADDAGVFAHRGSALVATADFITPVCDDPRRFGRVAAANSISDVYAMGGQVLLALNLCCFPQADAPPEVFTEILEGAAEKVKEAGGAVLGGHSVRDTELKFGLAVVGEAAPERLLTNGGARVGQRLVLTKPLGTGVLINAFKLGKLDEEGLEAAMLEMERLNGRAAELALTHGATGGTDVTGFGLVGHSLEMANSSGATLRLAFERLPVFDGFYRLVAKGVTTGCTDHNQRAAEGAFTDRAGLDRYQRELLFDPQTSGGLLLAVPAQRTEALLADLAAAGHQAADVGEVVAGAPAVEVV